MSIFEFSKTDILRSKIVNPAFYLVEIRDVIESVSKKGDSINIRLEGEIIQDEHGGTEFSGVPTPWLWTFNSKAPGMAIPFFKALDDEGDEIAAGSRRAMDKSLIGRKLYVKIDNMMNDGKLINNVVHEYKPYRG